MLILILLLNDSEVNVFFRFCACAFDRFCLGQRVTNGSKMKRTITIILRFFIVNASVWYINILTGK